MYKEVAIDPSCMADYHYYALLKQAFGFEKGRYVSADRNEWANEAFQVVKKSDIQPVKKKSVTNFLNKLKKDKTREIFLLADLRKDIKVKPWNEWFKQQEGLRKFSLCLSESGGADFVNHDGILEDCIPWRLPPSVSIKREAKEIIATLEPLIYLSKELIIVDQYFRLSKNKTLDELLETLRVCNVSKLTIVTGKETASLEQVFNREYKSKNTVSFTWIKAPDKYFHDRYFISDVGAVKAGHGFMPEVVKGIHADDLNINLVSRDEAQGVRDSLDKVLASGKAVVELAT